jgi:hypothetical protein
MMLAFAGLAMTLDRSGEEPKPFDYSLATTDTVLKAHGGAVARRLPLDPQLKGACYSRWFSTLAPIK